jgi:glycosyltransferase involved in cell wall biosynthesis
MQNKIDKITILTTSDFPYGGAPESFVRQMSLGIFHNGTTVEVIRYWGRRYSNVNDTPIKCTNYLFKKPLKYEIIKLVELICQIIYIPFFVIYRKFIEKNKLLILYSLDRSYFVFPITIICHIFRIKCIRVITEIYPDYKYVPYWWRKPNAIFYKWQLKYFDRFLDGIIVLSRYLQDICIKNGVPKERIFIVPHFIDLSIHHHTIGKKKKFRIGFCGSPSFEVGIIDLLDAFVSIIENQILDVELVIIGKVLPEVAQRIKELNLISPNIIYTGFLKKEEVEKQLSICDVLVNPRKSGILAESGFPTKLGEYFAARKPVVATCVGDLRYFFTDKKELFFAEPDNPISIANAIVYVYENKDIANEVGINGYNWALINLDFIQNSKRLLEFLKTI